MTTMQVVLLALVQGLTEFIPVSSSGHLLAARFFFAIPDTGGTIIDSYLHLGTLAAVLVYYWRTWLSIGRSLLSRDAESAGQRQLAAALAVGTVPAAVVGYAAQSWAETFFRSPHVLAVSFLFTAVMLWGFDRLAAKVQARQAPSLTDAAYIGFLQTLALIPGISRSGVTIAAGRWRGLSREQAVNFSFLLSAPIIAGAGLNGLLSLTASALFSPPQLVIGFLLAFGSGLLAIIGLLRVVRRLSFTPFVIYLIALAAVIFLYA